MLTTIANCTFSGNAASGAAGERGNTGLGGGLYCGYGSETTITDSIFWNNFGLKGQEIAVGSGFELDPMCGMVDVFYSNVKLSPNNVWADEDCELSLEPSNGNISEDPIFVTGPNGRYYLSHAIAGNLINSPCIDRGSDYASHVGLLGYTTRTDHIRDKGKVDMGYHYNTEDKCRFADFVFDGVINQLDFDEFAQLIGFDNFTKLAEEYWLNESSKKLDLPGSESTKELDLPSSEGDNWRNGADIGTDGSVDGNDVDFLLDCYEVADINAPEPDPSEWAIEPIKQTISSISMLAEEAFDAWSRDVQYYFDCVTPGGHDSGWISVQEYTDTGLNANQGYGYRVRARDKFGNMTKWSEIRYAGIDTNPPAPAPRIETMDANSATSITMTATLAYDDSGVEYSFEHDPTLGDANDSGWQTDPNYTVTGLDPNTEYGYRVRARDLIGNVTEWSDTEFVTTPVPADIDPPDPNPMEWDLVADANGFDGTPRFVFARHDIYDIYNVEMRAVIAVDAGGGPVEYQFECLDEPGFSSPWILTPDYSIEVGRNTLFLRFRVRAQDQFGNKTDWSVVDIAD
jgi:chitodextrinase